MVSDQFAFLGKWFLKDSNLMEALAIKKFTDQ